MVSRIEFVVAALSLISIGSGYYVKRESAFVQTMRCFKKAMDTSYQDFTEGELREAVCYYKRMDPCIDNLEKLAHPGTEPLLDLRVFYLWQELTFNHKLGRCKDVSSADVKNYASKSGIMAKMGLFNIENDAMEPCARDAFESCFFGDYDIKDNSITSLFDTFMKCQDKKGENCKADIWKHFIKTVDAWKKDLEKNRDKFNEFMAAAQP